ncbi:unnamed protein product [Heligmosomoides polygyrus]|uniref:DUF4325 domain-containing protein n=1 Tax=Heligmosomoides polygyrus TaxID=6339 RepID=A0A183G9M2_HELPZ|nr:unnamed protein product [Heligmosomoides polygyrus]
MDSLPFSDPGNPTMINVSIANLEHDKVAAKLQATYPEVFKSDLDSTGHLRLLYGLNQKPNRFFVQNAKCHTQLFQQWERSSIDLNQAA